MEIYSDFYPKKWWFSIAMLVYQRVYTVYSSTQKIQRNTSYSFAQALLQDYAMWWNIRKHCWHEFEQKKIQAKHMWFSCLGSRFFFPPMFSLLKESIKRQSRLWTPHIVTWRLIGSTTLVVVTAGARWMGSLIAWTTSRCATFRGAGLDWQLMVFKPGAVYSLPLKGWETSLS